MILMVEKESRTTLCNSIKVTGMINIIITTNVMQTVLLKLRQNSIIPEKAGYLSGKLKTLTSSKICKILIKSIEVCGSYGLWKFLIFQTKYLVSQKHIWRSFWI